MTVHLFIELITSLHLYSTSNPINPSVFCVYPSVVMPLSTQSQDEAAQYVLVASLDNARNISNILKAITFRDHAIFSATPNGLKVTVEDSKCLQANAFIQVCVIRSI